MTVKEYAMFIDQTIVEDGHLDCVPAGVFFFLLYGGLKYIIWTELRYRKQQ